MGIYLSQPSKGVHVESGHENSVRYALGEMQGWRKNMEDSHVACVNLSSLLDTASSTNAEELLETLKNVSVFGVFDGHGGKEVAKFVQTHYLSVLLKYSELLLSPETVGEALKLSFHTVDEMLEDPAFASALAIYRKIPNPSDIETANNTPIKAGPEGVEDESSDMSSVVRNLDDSIQGKGNVRGIQDKLVSDDSCISPKDAERTKALNNIPLRTLQVLEKLMKYNEVQAEAENMSDKAPVDKAPVDKPPVDTTPAESSAAALSTSSVALSIVEPSTLPIKEPEDKKQSSSSPVVTYTRSPRGTLQCQLENHRVHAGCTANVVVKWGNKLIIANAGDSRSVLCRGNNKALALSEDHKPNQPSELERIHNSGGFVTPEGRINGNLNLSRSLGDLKYKQNKTISKEAQMITAEPDIKIVDIEPTDKFIIIGCDGIWDCLTNQKACDFVRERLEQKMSISDIVQEVCHSCLAESPRSAEGIGCDNMTIMIIELNVKDE